MAQSLIHADNVQSEYAIATAALSTESVSFSLPPHDFSHINCNRCVIPACYTVAAGILAHWKSCPAVWHPDEGISPNLGNLGNPRGI